MDNLETIRERVDAIDERLIALFRERMAATAEIGAFKSAHALPVLDRTREREKLAWVAESVPPELRDYAIVLFNLLFEVSRANQSSLADKDTELIASVREAMVSTPDLFPQDAFVACQGVEGAYSQIAADRLFKHPNISYFSTFEGVFRAVREGFCAYGVLPLENSTAGTVNQVYDLMGAYDFHICRTVRLKVDHNLLARHGATVGGIRHIYSHQQAIEQCADFLASLPDVTVHLVENTAVAAKMVAESCATDVAALGSRSCASLYDLQVLRRGVQDMGNNYTRFACISKDLQIYPGADRTSLWVVTADEPGALYKVLARFYSFDINLSKLESRPLPDRDFDYSFYFDMDCPVTAPEFARLLNSLEDVCEEFRYLGSYSEIL